MLTGGFLFKIALVFWVNESIAYPSQPTTSVYQLSDVSFTDWTFQAWQSLNKRYSCLSKTSQINFDHKLTITRYEFAILLQACLDKLDKIIDRDVVVIKEDLAILQRLQQDFANELKSFSQGINILETDLAKLEDRQFSTTTQLKGEVLFQLGDSFGPNADDDKKDESQTFFGPRARLNFDTSFTGKDLLRTRLEGRDIARLDRVTGTLMTRLGTDGENNNEGPVSVSYEFPINKNGRIIFGPTGIKVNDIGVILNPLSSSGSGAISRFGRRDPATLRGPGGAGAGIQYQFNQQLQGSFGYVTSEDDAPNPQQGLFNGSQSFISQVLIEPLDNLELALTYTHSYWRSGDVDIMDDTGSFNANRPFGKKATSAHNFGWQFNWRTSRRFEFGGWFAYTKANQKEDENNRATILNGALTFLFPDLITEDNLGGIIIGVPPIVVDNTRVDTRDHTTSLHIEALYQIQITDNIQITPGILVITRPNHEDNTPIWVGTIRSRLTF